jgi:predicted PurR-regulated permease PerM
VLLGLGTGIAVAGACWALGIPGGLVLGAWAGLWAPVDTIGVVFGFVPWVTVVLVQSDAPVVVALLVLLAVAAATVLAQRAVVRRAQIRPGASIWVIAFAVGYSVAGTAGLVLALGAVAFVAAFLATPMPRTADLDAAGSTERANPRRGPIRPDDATARRLFVAAGRDEWWRSILTKRGVAVIAVTCVCATLLWLFLGSLGVFTIWLFIGLLLAIGFDRPVQALCRRAPRLPRAAAAAAVMLVAVAALSGVVLLALSGGSHADTSLSEQLPKAVARFEETPGIGPFLRDHHAADWVRRQLEEFPNHLADGRGGASWLPTIGARTGDLFWTLAIGIALLIDGSRLVDETRRRLPVRYRRQFGTFVDVSHQAIGGYLAGSAVVAALDALFVLILGLALGVPLAPALAVWAFLTNFVPQVGGLLGGAPLVLLAFSVGPVQALLALIGFVVYQFLENHLSGPTVISKAIDIRPVTSLLAALVGGAAGGMIGALLLTPLVGVATVVYELSKRGELPGEQVQLNPNLAGPTRADAST